MGRKLPKCLEINCDTILSAKKSRFCQKHFMLGDRNHFKGKKHTPEIQAIITAKLIGRPSWNKGLKLSEEHKVKLRGQRPIAQGENSHHWIKDRSLIKVSDRILNDPFRKQWTRAVKNRDSWKCKISNSDCSGRLEAHHILGWKDYPELRYQINNGISLCHAHHPKKRSEEKRLSPYFTELVSVS